VPEYNEGCCTLEHEGGHSILPFCYDFAALALCFGRVKFVNHKPLGGFYDSGELSHSELASRNLAFVVGNSVE
jgi:hypothetical protein